MNHVLLVKIDFCIKNLQIHAEPFCSLPVPTLPRSAHSLTESPLAQGPIWRTMPTPSKALSRQPVCALSSISTERSGKRQDGPRERVISSGAAT